MVIAEGQWCPIIFAEYEGELCAFTPRAQFIARREGQRVDWQMPCTPVDPWFHQLFINTAYVQLPRRIINGNRV